eukprot:766728-Hanusia_phi.AAC.1
MALRLMVVCFQTDLSYALSSKYGLKGTVKVQDPIKGNEKLLLQVDFCRILPKDFLYNFESLYSPDNIKHIQQAGELCEASSAVRSVEKLSSPRKSSLSEMQGQGMKGERKDLGPESHEGAVMVKAKGRAEEALRAKPRSQALETGGSASGVTVKASNNELRSECDQTYFSASGAISIPADDYSYKSCYWYIEPEGADVVTLTVQVFELEGDPQSCSYASMSISSCPSYSYDCGMAESWTLCGSIEDVPGTMTSNLGGFYVSLYVYESYADICITWGDGKCPLNVPRPQLNVLVDERTFDDYLLLYVAEVTAPSVSSYMRYSIVDGWDSPTLSCDCVDWSNESSCPGL